jgi:nitroreductase
LLTTPEIFMKAPVDHPVHDLIASRWSPYAFDSRTVATEVLKSLFEAARWSASSYNEQPWSYIVATQTDAPAFATLLSCLVEGNQAWAKSVPVLALGCTSLKFSRNGKPNVVAHHDLGQASANLSLEATARGVTIHQMAGILPDRARELYQIPEGVEALTGLAIGYPGDPKQLPEAMRGRDVARTPRKPIAEFVFSGAWGTTASVVK